MKPQRKQKTPETPAAILADLRRLEAKVPELMAAADAAKLAASSAEERAITLAFDAQVNDNPDAAGALDAAEDTAADACRAQRRSATNLDRLVAQIAKRRGDHAEAERQVYLGQLRAMVPRRRETGAAVVATIQAVCAAISEHQAVGRAMSALAFQAGLDGNTFTQMRPTRMYLRAQLTQFDREGIRPAHPQMRDEDVVAMEARFLSALEEGRSIHAISDEADEPALISADEMAVA